MNGSRYGKPQRVKIDIDSETFKEIEYVASLEEIIRDPRLLYGRQSRFGAILDFIDDVGYHIRRFTWFPIKKLIDKNKDFRQISKQYKNEIAQLTTTDTESVYPLLYAFFKDTAKTIKYRDMAVSSPEIYKEMNKVIRPLRRLAQENHFELAEKLIDRYEDKFDKELNVDPANKIPEILKSERVIKLETLLASKDEQKIWSEWTANRIGGWWD